MAAFKIDIKHGTLFRVVFSVCLFVSFFLFVCLLGVVQQVHIWFQHHSNNP